MLRMHKGITKICSLVDEYTGRPIIDTIITEVKSPPVHLEVFSTWHQLIKAFICFLLFKGRMGTEC